MAAAREGQAGPPSSFIFHGHVQQLSLSNQGRRGGIEGIREGREGIEDIKWSLIILWVRAVIHDINAHRPGNASKLTKFRVSSPYIASLKY